MEFDNNTVNGPLTITHTTGTVPPPDTGSLVDVGNKVSGPVHISQPRHTPPGRASAGPGLASPIR